MAVRFEFLVAICSKIKFQNSAFGFVFFSLLAILVSTIERKGGLHHTNIATTYRYHRLAFDSFGFK